MVYKDTLRLQFEASIYVDWGIPS